MSRELRLQVILDAIDKASAPFKRVSEGSSTLARSVKAARDQLRQMEKSNKLIESFRDTDRAIKVKTNSIKGLEPRLKQLKEAMAATLVPSKALVKEFERVRKEAAGLKGTKTKLLEKSQRLRTELEKSGMPTRELARHQLELKNRIKDASTALGAPLVMAVRQYSNFEDAMLGVARQVEGAKDEAGNLTPLYYEFGEAIKAMAERIPLATTGIAELVEAGARMGIQGKDNLLTFAETTAITATAFNLPVEQVGADMAKLSQLYKVPIANISELGDAINWLDDNAQSQGGDIIEVMKRVAGTADTVKMSYRDAAALGSTFLSLGAGAEVAASAANAMMRELSVATMLPERFQTGLKMLGMTAENVQRGMTKDATGTILEVLDAIKALPEEKRLEAATRLFGKQFGDDAAKLVANMDEYRKQLALVNDEQGRGSMVREAEIRNKTLTANYEKLKNSIFNVASEIGEELKPTLVEIMQSVAKTLRGIREWMKANPELTATLVKGAAAVAAIVTAVGALALGAAAVLGPIAMFKFSLLSLAWRAGAVWKGFAWLGPLAGKIFGLVNPVMRLAAAFGTGYAVGTVLNDRLNDLVSGMVGYRTSLGGLIADVVISIRERFGSVGNYLLHLLGRIISFFQTLLMRIFDILKELPAQMMKLGGQIVDGLWNGISGKWDDLKGKLANLPGSMIDTFKDKLGIRSPSRVFAQLGDDTMAGLQAGLQHGGQGPLGTVQRLAGQLAAAGAIAFGAMPAMALDTRPPLSTPSASGGGGGASIQIVVNAAPGMDEQKLAQLVAREVARVQREQAAKRRSLLTDMD